MKILPFLQDSTEWHAWRSRPDARNASEASIIMGCSPYMTREELIKKKALGIEKEHSDYAKNVLFPEGHRIEAAVRPIICEQIGDDLYPVCGESDDGYLSASFDGLTMDHSTVWECKSWNREKFARLAQGYIPDGVMWGWIRKGDE